MKHMCTCSTADINAIYMQVHVVLNFSRNYLRNKEGFVDQDQ
ncbi:hypothetical protein MAR_017715 [Mya arenaria]|uniref:Uncharacterized protein n=1 Tax=Mya arenaria TaxID=6604 RepID=A0ABY7EFQ6_MYAAR|nr:hypothetical protein MAR_017715 [Mya arenaria]